MSGLKRYEVVLLVDAYNEDDIYECISSSDGDKVDISGVNIDSIHEIGDYDEYYGVDEDE